MKRLIPVGMAVLLIGVVARDAGAQLWLIHDMGRVTYLHVLNQRGILFDIRFPRDPGRQAIATTHPPH